MLTYHPVFDSYHCFLRMATLLLEIDSKELPVEVLRILDFYLCFPSEISEFKFQKKDISKKKLFTGRVNSYNKIGDRMAIFNNLKAIQDGVFEVFLSRSIIDFSAFMRGSFLVLRENIPEEIYKFLREQKSLDLEAKELLVNSFSKIELLGPDGLKSRSGLMDYRYDMV